MKKTLQILCFVAASLLAAAACTHKSNEVQPGPGPVDTTNVNVPDTALCFERDILPIFISNCAKSGCHDAASHQEGYIFTSYETITARKFVKGNAHRTELYEKITDNDPKDIMPPPPNTPLTAQQIGLIFDWIQRGAPNTTGCVSNCDSTAFTFSATIQPLLSKNCRGCHNSVTASSGVNLDNYAGVKAVADNGQLIGAVKHLPGFPAMPQGGQQLSACQIRQLEKWIAAGTLNN